MLEKIELDGLGGLTLPHETEESDESVKDSGSDEDSIEDIGGCAEITTETVTVDPNRGREELRKKKSVSLKPILL